MTDVRTALPALGLGLLLLGGILIAGRAALLGNGVTSEQRRLQPAPEENAEAYGRIDVSIGEDASDAPAPSAGDRPAPPPGATHPPALAPHGGDGPRGLGPERDADADTGQPRFALPGLPGLEDPGLDGGGSGGRGDGVASEPGSDGADDETDDRDEGRPSERGGAGGEASQDEAGAGRETGEGREAGQDRERAPRRHAPCGPRAESQAAGPAPWARSGPPPPRRPCGAGGSEAEVRATQASPQPAPTRPAQPRQRPAETSTPPRGNPPRGAGPASPSAAGAPARQPARHAATPEGRAAKAGGPPAGQRGGSDQAGGRSSTPAQGGPGKRR